MRNSIAGNEFATETFGWKQDNFQHTSLDTRLPKYDAQAEVFAGRSAENFSKRIFNTDEIQKKFTGGWNILKNSSNLGVFSGVL